MATLTPKYKVGDRVRVNRSSPNETWFYNGQELTVNGVQNDGRYVRYIFAGYDDRSSYRVTERNLDLVKSAPAPEPVVPFEKMTKEQLAKRVVKVAQEYAEAHSLCEVVEEALAEMGLGDFFQPLTRKVLVTVEIEVEGERGWDDETYLDEAKDMVNGTFKSAEFPA